MATIRQITSREILNSKATPTIETTVILSDNSVGVSATPSATSFMDTEAKEIRDNNPQYYGGMGVSKAIELVKNVISPALVGKEAQNFAEIDKLLIGLDGTPDKSHLGSNTMLSVSMSVAKASAKSSVLPLYLYLKAFQKKELPIKIPTPIFNIINGGEHAGGNLDFQEFMIIPATSKPFDQALAMCVMYYHTLKETLSQNNLSSLTGEEGGFAPTLASNAEAFGLMKQAVESANLKFGYDIFFGLDAASNRFFNNNRYSIKDKAMSFTTRDLIKYYQDLNKQYSFLYLEDPLSVSDVEGWKELYNTMSTDTLIVGDDFTTTNFSRLQIALSQKAISAIIIKPNQIGTVIEALAITEVAREAGLKIVVSGRSGETNDDFIADFAVAVSADFVKFGAPARGERVAKYNRLLQIQEQIKNLGTTA